MASKSILSILIISILIGSFQNGLAQWAYEPVSNSPISGDVFSDQKGLYECLMTFYGTAPLCITEIFETVSTGRLALGQACCTMIKEVKDDCWKTMFPVSPDLPPFLKEPCGKED